MSTFQLYKTVIKQIDKYRKHCLWRGADINAKNPPKAAWSMVCLPKKEGGLGVLNLKTQNEALLLKHLHKFYNRADIPWVHLIWEKHYNAEQLPDSRRKGSFWWKDINKLLLSYKGLAMVHIYDGATCLFWEDLWNNRVPAQQFLELFSFAKKKNISIKTARNANGPEALLHLPISDIPLQQLLILANDLNNLQQTQDFDIWSYIWGSSTFSISKAYVHLTGHCVTHATFNWLWKSACQKKHKVFFWLLLKDRLSTRELLRRKNMILQDYSCVLCPSTSDESLEHLFIHCNFERACWASIGLIVGNDGPYITLEHFKQQLGVPFFMEIIILMSWCIWMQRNDLIFKGEQPSIDACYRHFKKEFALVILRAKTRHKEHMLEWLALV